MTERLTIPATDGRSTPWSIPPIGSGQPRLDALLAVEVQPGKTVYYHLELDRTPGACTIDMDRDEPDPIDPTTPLSHLLYGPRHINATISGTVVSDRPDYRPPAHTTVQPTPAIGTGQ